MDGGGGEVLETNVVGAATLPLGLELAPGQTTEVELQLVVRLADGLELLVETAVGMRPDAPSVLLADDAAPAAPGVTFVAEPDGQTGFRLKATWPGRTLTRQLALIDGQVAWTETWSSRASSQIRSPTWRGRAYSC